MRENMRKEGMIIEEKNIKLGMEGEIQKKGKEMVSQIDMEDFQVEDIE